MRSGIQRPRFAPPHEVTLTLRGCTIRQSVPRINFKVGTACCGYIITYSLHCSSFLRLPFRILNIDLVKQKKGTTMETIGITRHPSTSSDMPLRKTLTECNIKLARLLPLEAPGSCVRAPELFETLIAARPSGLSVWIVPVAWLHSDRQAFISQGAASTSFKGTRWLKDSMPFREAEVQCCTT